MNLGAILPLILIALLFWVLVIRPTRKRQQSVAETQRNVQIGTDVMLSSGIYGTVVGSTDDIVQLQVAPGMTLKVARQAVVRVITPADETPETPDASVVPGSTLEPEPGTPTAGPAEPVEETPTEEHRTWEPPHTPERPADEQD